MKTATRWLSDLTYPELWEAIDEALVATSDEFQIISPIAERWVTMPKRERAKLHGELRAALRRRMKSDL